MMIDLSTMTQSPQELNKLAYLSIDKHLFKLAFTSKEGFQISHLISLNANIQAENFSLLSIYTTMNATTVLLNNCFGF